MTKQNLVVVTGGKYKGDRHLDPEVQEIVDLLRSYRAAIGQAYQPLKKHQADLEQDWNIRPTAFWQEMLAALPPLREAIKPCTTCMQEAHGCLLTICYDVLIPLTAVSGTHIDTVAILLTAYLPVCHSQEPSHLHRRRAVLAALQALSQELEQGLASLGPKGQRKCIAAYRQRQPAIRRKQGEGEAR